MTVTKEKVKANVSRIAAPCCSARAQARRGECNCASAGHLDEFDLASADTGLSHGTEFRPMQHTKSTSAYRSCFCSMPSVEPMFLRIRSDTSGFSSHSSASAAARTSAGTMIRRQLHSNHTPLHTIPSRMPCENVRDSAPMSCLHCRPLPRCHAYHTNSMVCSAFPSKKEILLAQMSSVQGYERRF
jgi:hypothetical protein